MRELGIEKHVDKIFKNPKFITDAQMFFCHERMGIITISVYGLCMILLNKCFSVSEVMLFSSHLGH